MEQNNINFNLNLNVVNLTYLSVAQLLNMKLNVYLRFANIVKIYIQCEKSKL